MLAPSKSIRVTKTVGKKTEFRVPLTVLATRSSKSIETTAILDSGAGGTFINWMFIRKHNIPTHKLSKPFNIRTADGSHSKDGKVSNYCILGIRIDRRTMFGKFNVTTLSERDDILLGCPWLSKYLSRVVCPILPSAPAL